ncbi:hypothetical protein SUGI_1096910 [Cryptomeria japonica]|uniref:uncharacterized protein LOC131859304 n=1 Tax=Cryptomeria japonica TaxID=3369 RepID=UPI0024147231|nr:uncharacterized protein LOC131859304 [Cryptomeria japonica]GLJ51611.1 hypothetical protein SUGI_1096910 [Cryptomeria japonica]
MESESIKKTKQAEDDRDSNKRSLREKERETSELQKSVVRLQQLCTNQERTIGELWLQLDNDINNVPQDKDAGITELQKEQLRLVGVEHGLRKDLENCRWEADALRHENTSLLERVKSKEKGGDPKSMLATLQERDNVLELDVMAQSLRRKVESWKNSVGMQEEILQEKSHIFCDESLKQDIENPEASEEEQQHIENEEGFKQVQQELTETLLVKILRETLYSNAVYLEQLQDECATLVRGQEVLRSSIESLQDSLSSSNQKEKELVVQLGGNENTIKCLQADLQECLKEPASLRTEIAKVSKERDGFQKDSEQLISENVKLIAEVEALKMRVEKLNEDL